MDIEEKNSFIISTIWKKKTSKFVIIGYIFYFLIKIFN